MTLVFRSPSLLVALMLTGCQPPTRFIGEPHIDVPTCRAKCAADNLQMSGIVYMGEYSSACLCELPRAPGEPTSAPGGAPGAVAASTGVVMQMRRAEAAQHNSTMPGQPHGAPIR